MGTEMKGPKKMTGGQKAWGWLLIVMTTLDTRFK